MKIGELVKQHIKRIFFHCDNVDHQEIYPLLDPKNSKNTFGINYPFCIELQNLERSQSRRYWTEIYLVRGKQVRVTSQWFETSRPLFIKYLEAKQIALELDSPRLGTNDDRIPQPFGIQYGPLPEPYEPKRRYRRIPSSRYRGPHIGNAQNLFIRNILCSLGLESFNERDWNSTKDFFLNKCVYCGTETELLMEHAIPINKEKLGEHRLGNLVPSCKPCNDNKGGRNFREFLGENAAAISKIEEYMNSRNYVPLEDNEQMKMILDMAHKEIAALADRYIMIINELFFPSSNGERSKE